MDAAVDYVWRVAEPDRSATVELARNLGIPRLIAHLLRLRGVADAKEAGRFLEPSKDQLSDPFLLDDMDRAVARLDAARRRTENVLVFGDYDVDGIAGTAILMNALRRFGLTSCGYAMPSRITEGFGLSPAWVDRAHQRGVTLIVTVDNGANARAAAARAKALGIDLIVTDHHSLEGELPTAVAVVNPKRHGPTHPAAAIAGAAVAFKLAWALTGQVADIDLAALGTVADIVPLRGENRALVALGLKELARGERPGLVALAQVAGIQLESLNADNIAFHLGPRINAGGRLGDGAIGLELLLTEDPAQAGRLARQLNQANQERRRIEQETLDRAAALLAEEFRPEQRSIVLAQPGWHPGVIGIVAARLQRAYHRPVVLIAIDETGLGRGSARSIPGFDLMAALSAAAGRLVRFGGHRAAGGITLRQEAIDAFRTDFEAAALAQLPDADFRPALDIDALVALTEIDGQLVRSFERLRPFGNGNPAPVFCSYGVTALPGSVRTLRGGHLKLAFGQGGASHAAIGFNMADSMAPVAEAGPLDIAFSPQLNTWRGQTSVQLLLKDLRPANSNGNP